jgi:hypothetical protein
LYLCPMLNQVLILAVAVWLRCMSILDMCPTQLCLVLADTCDLAILAVKHKLRLNLIGSDAFLNKTSQ